MSTTTQPQKAVTNAPTQTTETDGLATIVAQTTQFEALPEFDVYRTACAWIQDSVELASEGAI